MTPRGGASATRRHWLAAAALGLTAGARAQTAGPPLVIVVPFSAGSGPDAVVRAVARELSTSLAQTVLVDNRPGAGSVLAATAVARAAPDGRTLLVTGNVAFTGNPHVMKHLPYDPVADFTPVSGLVRGPMLLYVNPGRLPVRGVPALLAQLRQEPGRHSYAYTSITSRLPAEVLQQAAGVTLVGVPYRSGASALPDLLAGRTDMLFTDFSAWPHVAGGRLRAMAVTDTQRSPLAPEVPTFAEAGVEQMDFVFWLGAYLPARAEPAWVSRLHAHLVQALRAPAVQVAQRHLGTSDFALPPAALAAHQSREFEAWGRLIRAARITPE
ncbi:MAG: tripartite tricarboxylate transporter substrate-binding protein [Rubrivivax sp.]|nr:tripartite tricarboxylate transporter substrate-binding protein [Rubrivivax sp.]